MKLIHSMIRVRDEAKSIAFYAKALGLSVLDRYDFSSFSLIYLRDDESSFELELTVNHDRDAATCNWPRPNYFSSSNFS